MSSIQFSVKTARLHSTGEINNNDGLILEVVVVVVIVLVEVLAVAVEAAAITTYY